MRDRITSKCSENGRVRTSTGDVYNQSISKKVALFYRSKSSAKVLFLEKETAFRGLKAVRFRNIIPVLKVNHTGYM